jgi:hypothetical protein
VSPHGDGVGKQDAIKWLDAAAARRASSTRVAISGIECSVGPTDGAGEECALQSRRKQSKLLPHSVPARVHAGPFPDPVALWAHSESTHQDEDGNEVDKMAATTTMTMNTAMKWMLVMRS